MTLFRGGLLALCACSATTAVRGQQPAPAQVNSAYEQLPTSWDLPQPALPAESLSAEPLPPADPAAGTIQYPPSTQPVWSAQSPAVDAPAIASTQIYAATDCVTCGSACADYCTCFGAYPPHSFWFATAELTVLDPRHENGLFSFNDDDSSVAPRLTFGWESPRGLGLRARFWWLGDDIEIISDDFLPPDTEVELRSHKFDFDAYRRFTFDGSSIAVGGGVTAAFMAWGLNPEFRIEDAGGGASFFAEGRHELTRSPVSAWGLVARGRWSSLVGEWRDRDSPGRTRGDSTMEILEAAVGWDYVRQLQHCDLFAQYLLEAQTWDGTLVGDLGFLGVAMSLGARW